MNPGMEPVPDPRDLLRHAGWLRALARSLATDAATADDLVQETWAAAVEHPPAHAATARAWLGRVLRNAAAQRFRARSRRTRRERAAARHEELPSSGELAERMELQRALVEAVLALPEPHRSAVVLRYYEGLSAVEIAHKRDLPAATVRSHLKRGLDELRRSLDRRHGGRREAWSALLLPWLDARSATAAAGAAALAGGVLTMSTGVKLGVAAGIAAVAVIGYEVAMRAPAEPAPAERARDVARAAEPVEPASPEVETPRAEPSGRRAVPAEVPLDGPAVARQPDHVIEAEIVDPDGAPIEGASMAFAYFTTDDGADLASGPSDTEGRIIFELDPTYGFVDWTYELCVTAVGYAPRRIEAALERGERTRLGRVVLQPAGRIRGRVLDAAGLAVEGARIRVTEGGTLPLELALVPRTGPGWSELPETRSGADGGFAVEDLAPGFVRAWARTETSFWAVSDPIEVRPREETDGIVLRLEEASPEDFIEGVVLDPAGHPVRGCYVSARSTRSGSFSGDVESDDEGRFRFLLTEQVPHELRASDPFEQRWPDAVLPRVEPGAQVVLWFNDPSYAWIEVRDRDGLAIQGAEVVTERKNRTTRLRSLPLPEDETVPGRFRLRLPGETFFLHAGAPGFAEADFGPLEPDALTDPFVCTLGSVPGIRGRVLADSRPVSGARVGLYQGPREASGALQVFYYGGFASLTRPLPEDSCTTDAKGEFLLTPKAGGDYVVRAELEDRAPAEQEVLDFRPAEGRGGIELRLTEGGAIEGRAGWDETELEGRLLVVASRGDGRVLQAPIDEDGGYHLDHLISGPWTVELVHADDLDLSTMGISRPGASAERPELRPTCVGVEGETTVLDLELARYEVSGRLLVDGHPAAAWVASLRSRSVGRNEKTTLDGEGRFTLGARRAGLCELSLESPPEQGSLRLRAELDVQEGENPWELAIATGPVEVVNLPDPCDLFLRWDGPLACNALIRIEPDESGNALLPRVPAGRVQLVRFPQGLRRPETMQTLLTVEHHAEETTRVVVP